MAGFFSKSEMISAAPLSNIPLCGACGLFKLCRSPKMKVTGKGKRKILIIGEAPGEDEDKHGIQFCGLTGKLLEKTLKKYGINLREDCWLTNAIICRPPKNKTPDSDKISYCRPNLLNTIKALKPEIIIPLGAKAVESLMSWLWKESGKQEMSKWAGFHIPHQKLNAWICPTYHPSYVARQVRNGRPINPQVKIIWKRQLKAISKLKGRPWKEVPDYKKMVEVILDEKEAAKQIRWIIAQGGWAAFDYEANSLKPEWNGTEIVCCSICWEGKKTIAFPMSEGSQAWKAMEEFVQSRRIKKIASNLKYEDRWTRRKMKFRIRRWKHDTMNTAHIVDCRRGITGLKFQAFIVLGQEPYNTHIERLLEAKKGSKLNQIRRDIAIRDLLLYNGMDSLCEYFVAMNQREQLGLAV